MVTRLVACGGPLSWHYVAVGGLVLHPRTLAVPRTPISLNNWNTRCWLRWNRNKPWISPGEHLEDHSSHHPDFRLRRGHREACSSGKRAILNLHARHGSRLSRRFKPAVPGGYRLEFLRRAQRELNLTAEQRERVEKIFSQSQERTKRLMEPVTPHLREELDRAKREFSEILTPPQRARFDELLKQRVRDQRREKGSRAQEKEAPVEPPARSTDN